jgi:hypothetical protein
LLWKTRMLQENKERLDTQHEGESRVTVGNNSDDTSVWLLHTQWPQTFAGKSLLLLTGTRYIDMDRETRKRFPRWSSKLSRFVFSLFNKVFVRAKATLNGTCDTICCWAHSVNPDKPYKRPLCQLQSSASEEKYVGIWKQFLLYCLRVSDLDETTGRGSTYSPFPMSN